MIVGELDNGIVTLEPEPGMAITNGDTVTTGIVYLGNIDSPDNWRDCDLPEPEETTGHGLL